MSDPSADLLHISSPIYGSNDSKGVRSEKEVVSRSSYDRDIHSTGDEDVHVQTVANFGSEEDLEKVQLSEAAVTIQAACRGYQVITSLRLCLVKLAYSL
jgi:hypothetical protein